MTEYLREAPVEFIGPVRTPDGGAIFDAMCLTCASQVKGSNKISPLLLACGVTVGNAVDICTQHHISSMEEGNGWHRVAVVGFYPQNYSTALKETLPRAS